MRGAKEPSEILLISAYLFTGRRPGKRPSFAACHCDHIIHATGRVYRMGDEVRYLSLVAMVSPTRVSSRQAEIPVSGYWISHALDLGNML
jgi:hypothetical protein